MMLLHTTHSTHGPVRPWSHWELKKNTGKNQTKVIYPVATLKQPSLKMAIAYIRSISTRADGVHHCVDVFT